MDPAGADRYALFAFVPVGMFDVRYRRDVGTGVRHGQGAYHGVVSGERWPELPDAWKPTYTTARLGEFILPYEAVRTAVDPDRALLDFIDSTYTGAATLAEWDRAVLERPLAVIRAVN